MSYASAESFFDRLLSDDSFRAKASECRNFRDLFQFTERSGYSIALNELSASIPASVKNAKINQHGTPVEQVSWLLSSGLYR